MKNRKVNGMKIGVIGATGKAGDLIAKELTDRGHSVTAIVRHPDKLQGDWDVLEKDLFDLNTDDLTPFDVVVDAFNAPRGQENLHKMSIEHLADILKNTHVRLMVVGGAGSLYVDDHITRLFETPSFPPAFKPTSQAMAESLESLANSDDLNWTYLSPAPNFIFGGPRKNQYVLGNDLIMSDKDGKSEISYADYAIAMADEIENEEHNREHISVIW